MEKWLPYFVTNYVSRTWRCLYKTHPKPNYITLHLGLLHQYRCQWAPECVEIKLHLSLSVPKTKTPNVCILTHFPINPNLNNDHSDLWHTFATLCVMYMYHADCFEHGKKSLWFQKTESMSREDVWLLLSYARLCSMELFWQTYLFTITHILPLHEQKIRNINIIFHCKQLLSPRTLILLLAWYILCHCWKLYDWYQSTQPHKIKLTRSVHGLCSRDSM